MLKLKRVRKFTRSPKKPKRVNWDNAEDIEKRIKFLVTKLQLDWVEPKRVYCFRSTGSKSRAYARIWGLSRVWQKALGRKPAYIIEVLAEKFDHLNNKEQDKILLHEIAHIPKNFSGALLPHTRSRGKRNFHDRVQELVRAYEKL